MPSVLICRTTSRWIGTILCVSALGLASAKSAEQDLILQSLKSGQTAQGQKLLKTELQKLPKDVNLRLLEGAFQAQSGQKDKAIETFKKIAAEHPTLPEAYNNPGVLYAERNELDLAKASFERALQTGPSYSASHKNLMDLNARLAKQAYARAFRLEEPAKVAAPSGLTMLAIAGTPTIPAVAGPLPTVVPVAPPAVIAEVKPAPVPPASGAPAVPPITPAPAPKPQAKTEPADSTPTPAPSTVPASNVTAAESAAVEKAVRAWASAWSKRDVQQYLDAYAPNFEPTNKQARASWAKDRRVRIEQRKFIRVTVSRLQISVKGSQAQVKLEQQYDSDGLNTNTRKTLDLVNTGGRWLIVREKAS